MTERLRRYSASLQCNPVALIAAIGLAVAAWLAITHGPAVLAVIRAALALTLAGAGLGLLAWVTIGLTHRAAQTVASEPQSGPQVASGPTAAPGSVPGSVPVSEPSLPGIPATGPAVLITRDGRTIALADPGPLPQLGPRS